MNNMAIWDKVKQPPKTALKPINAGRLRGKTDINPQWRYQVMTDVFGPCGVGWRYEIVRTWNEAATEGQVFAFAEISLFIKTEDIWSEAIPGIGGSMLVTKEQAGLHASDEGYKMAITDALSVAMKMIGVGSDIYAGLWDGSKYATPVQQQSQSKSNASTSNNPASDAQIKAINTLLAKAGITESARHEKVSRMLNLKADLVSFRDLSKTQASTVIEMLSAEKPKAKVKEEAPETNVPAGEAKSARDRDPGTIQSIGDLYTACLQDFKMTKQQVLAELNVNDQSDIVDKPGECYIRVASVR